MKKTFIFLFTVIVVTATIGFSVLSYSNADNSTFDFKGEINEYAMNTLPKPIQGSITEKLNNDYQTITKGASSVIKMTVAFDDKDENIEVEGIATGSIHIGNDIFEYKVNGPFFKFFDSETKKTYYYGRAEGNVKGVNLNEQEIKNTELDGDVNSQWIVIFNPQNTKEEFYISTGIGYDSTTGVLIFGNLKFLEEYNDMLHKNYPEAEANWK